MVRVYLLKSVCAKTSDHAESETNVARGIPSGCSNYVPSERTVYHPERTNYMLFSYFLETNKIRKNSCIYTSGIFEHIDQFSPEYQIVISTNKTIHRSRVLIKETWESMSLLQFLEDKEVNVSVFDCSLFAENFLYTVFRFHPMIEWYRGTRNFYLFDLDTKMEYNQELMDAAPQSDIPTVLYNSLYDKNWKTTLYLMLVRYTDTFVTMVDKSFTVLSEYCAYCGFAVSRSTIWMYLIASNVSLLAGFTAFLHMPCIQHGDVFDRLFFEQFFETNIEGFGIDELYLKLLLFAFISNHTDTSLFEIQMNPDPYVKQKINNMNYRIERANQNRSKEEQEELEILEEYDLQSVTDSFESIDSVTDLLRHLLYYNDYVDFEAFLSELTKFDTFGCKDAHKRQKYMVTLVGNASFQFKDVHIIYRDKNGDDCSQIEKSLGYRGYYDLK